MNTRKKIHVFMNTEKKIDTINTTNTASRMRERERYIYVYVYVYVYVYLHTHAHTHARMRCCTDHRSRQKKNEVNTHE